MNTKLLIITSILAFCPPPMTPFEIQRVDLEDGWTHSTGGAVYETRSIQVDYIDNRKIVRNEFSSQGQAELTNNRIVVSARQKYRQKITIPKGTYTIHQDASDYTVCAEDGSVIMQLSEMVRPTETEVKAWAYTVEIDRYGDLNSDGIIDGYDVGLFFAGWGVDGTTDFNNDGITDGQDLGILFENWDG